jgi:hypothetical protein
LPKIFHFFVQTLLLLLLLPSHRGERTSARSLERVRARAKFPRIRVRFFSSSAPGAAKRRCRRNPATTTTIFSAKKPFQFSRIVEILKMGNQSEVFRRKTRNQWFSARKFVRKNKWIGRGFHTGRLPNATLHSIAFDPLLLSKLHI